MINSDVDLIIGITTLVAARVKPTLARNRIPLVFTLISDPQAAGLVKTMRESGDNISGIKAFRLA